eukprot:4020088-Lingulodinium_polyedra.AAC.1
MVVEAAAAQPRQALDGFFVWLGPTILRRAWTPTSSPTAIGALIAVAPSARCSGLQPLARTS